MSAAKQWHAEPRVCPSAQTQAQATQASPQHSSFSVMGLRPRPLVHCLQSGQCPCWRPHRAGKASTPTPEQCCSHGSACLEWRGFSATGRGHVESVPVLLLLSQMARLLRHSAASIRHRSLDLPRVRLRSHDNTLQQGGLVRTLQHSTRLHKRSRTCHMLPKSGRVNQSQRLSLPCRPCQSISESVCAFHTMHDSSHAYRPERHGL